MVKKEDLFKIFIAPITYPKQILKRILLKTN